MYTKSLIQTQIERTEERSRFANDINRLLESYTIEDGVFGIVNNKTYELSKGYFVAVKEFDALNELIKEMDQSTQAVRIKNGEFILGNVYESIADVDGDAVVFSIEMLKDL